MRGWHFTVSKSASNAPSGRAELAVWQAAVSVLGWLDQLVKEDKAISLGGDG